MQLSNLPDEIVQHVCAYLCLITSAQTATLCRSFARAATNTMDVYKSCDTPLPLHVPSMTWSLQGALACLHILEKKNIRFCRLQLETGCYYLPELQMSSSLSYDAYGSNQRAIDINQSLSSLKKQQVVEIVGCGIGETILEGELKISRGCQTVLKNLSIVNPMGPGILVSAGGKLDASKIEIADCASRGIAIVGTPSSSAIAHFHNCTIKGCGGAGVFASQGSKVFIEDSAIIHNATTGVVARNRAFVQLRGSRTIIKENPNALSSASGAEIEIIFDASNASKRPQIKNAIKTGSGWGHVFSRSDGSGIRRWSSLSTSSEI